VNDIPEMPAGKDGSGAKIPEEKKGGVLERVLKIDYDKVVVIENYDATELTAEKGDVVKGMRPEAGWVWCSNMENKTGWLPERNLKQIFGDWT
jgi:hypothetical protein